MEPLKIVAIQFEETTDIFLNFNKHVEYIRNVDCDLLVFPECSLIGYDLKNILEYKNKNQNIKKLENIHNQLINIIQSTGKTVIFGSITKDKNGNLFNCAFIVNKSTIQIYKKITLTEKEKNIFNEGNEPIFIDLKDRRLAPIICRDQSNVEIFSKLKEKNVNIILILSAHYYEPKETLWKKYKNIAIPITRALDFRINIIKVNTVGILDNAISHGNSLAVNNNGKILKLLDEFNESILDVTL